MAKSSMPRSELHVSFARLPLAGVSSGGLGDNAKFKAAKARALIAGRKSRVQPAATTQRDASSISGNGNSIGMTEETRRSTRGGQSTNATADASEKGASKEGMQGESVARSLHDPLLSPHS